MKWLAKYSSLLVVCIVSFFFFFFFGLSVVAFFKVGHDWVTSLSLFTFMHWRRKWHPTPVFLPGESQGRGSLVGCRLWDCTELDTTSDLAAVAAALYYILWLTTSFLFVFWCFDICSLANPPQFSSVQSFSHVRLFWTPWITARQASLSITNSRSSLKLMSIESVMPSYG